MSDLIRREDAMALWDKYHYEIATKAVEFDKDLRAIPSAEPKRGKWVLWNEPGNECAFCSACDAKFDQIDLYIGGTDYPKYCPECGTRMENWHESE